MRTLTPTASTSRDDALLHLGVDPAPERQRQVVLGGGLLGLRQRAGLLAEMAQRRRSCGAASRSTRRTRSRARRARRRQAALARANDGHVVEDARERPRVLGRVVRRRAPHTAPCPRAGRAFTRRGAVARWRSGLERVQPRVRPDQLERLLVPRSVEAQHPDPLRDPGVRRGNEAAVAEREQVLGREETEGGRDAGGRDTRRAEGPGRRPRAAAVQRRRAWRAAPAGRRCTGH